MIAEGKDGDIIDVDGSYLYAKQQKLSALGQLVAPMSMPPAPPSGWKAITAENHHTLTSALPPVTAGTSIF